PAPAYHCSHGAGENWPCTVASASIFGGTSATIAMGNLLARDPFRCDLGQRAAETGAVDRCTRQTVSRAPLRSTRAPPARKPRRKALRHLSTPANPCADVASRAIESSVVAACH